MGLFITFEGVEGSGKSTQMALLNDFLLKRGHQVLALREPGGTPLGENVRMVLLNTHGGMEISSISELFLYEACRAQLVTEVIRPALEAGLTILCDRFTDSTLAYQGWGRGLDKDFIRQANGLATSGLVPDVTILLDMDPEEGVGRAVRRIEARGGAMREDRFEKEDLEFHRRVRKGYEELAAGEPGRIIVVDAGGEIPSIHKEICDIITARGL